jgi:Cytochrome P460
VEPNQIDIFAFTVLRDHAEEIRAGAITPLNAAGSLYSGLLTVCGRMCCFLEGGTTMKGIALLLVAVVILEGIVAFTAPAPLHAADSAAPTFVTKIPPGYRDWRLISVSHEAGNLNSIGAVLGNDVAIKAYREGKLPFPDGTIIAALHYGHVPSAENNKVFGQANLSSLAPHEHSVYGQGLHEVRRDGRLGVRYLHRRQTRRRGVNEKLLPLP